MKLGYYPGCSLEGTAKEFDHSLREVLKLLEIDLEEINDWSCCGASSAHTTSHLLSVTLPALNLIQAAKQGLEDVVAPCAACFNRLVVSQHEMKYDEKIRTKVEHLIEDKFVDGTKVLNIIQLFQKIGVEKIKEKIKVDLSELNLACYYGCLLVRPNDLLHFDDAENPKMMEEIITACGAKAVEWNLKTECCGAAHSIARTDIVEKLCKNILDDAVDHKADMIVVACPMCHSNLDMRQRNISRHYTAHRQTPVIYLSQIIGIAMGIDFAKLELNLHFINPVPLLEKKILKEAVL
jgi:heterodisulfide reductase subunit B